MHRNNQWKGNRNNQWQGNGNWQGNQNNQRQNQSAKKSGCTFRENYQHRVNGKKVPADRPIIFGWNKSKSKGLISFVAVPAKEFETKNPLYQKWVVTMQFPDRKETFTGFYNTAKKVLTIPDLQMVANPHKGAGYTASGKHVTGYFGTYVRRSN